MKAFAAGLAGLLLRAAPALAATVFTPADPAPHEREAARELAEHLSTLTGAPVDVAAEGARPAGERAFYVGATRFAADHGVDFAGLGPEAWRVKGVEDAVVLGGGAPRGPAYAVLEYLEALGVRWLDERSTHFPPAGAWAWPEGLDLRGEPAFAWRAVYAYFHEPQGPRRAFLARNRQNFFHGENWPAVRADTARWGVTKYYGSPGECHTYAAYTADWGDAEADLFALHENGTRPRAVNGSGPGQVCVTDPRARALFAETLRRFIRADREAAAAAGEPPPALYDVSHNDNHGKCVCARCLAAAKKYGSYAGAVLEFTNAVAGAVADEFPDVRVQMNAYTFAKDAPKGIRPAPNVVVRLAQLGYEFQDGERDVMRPFAHPNNAAALRQLDEWSTLGPLNIWGYGIIYAPQYEISSNLRAVARDMPLYHARGVRGYFLETESPLKTALYAARLWLALRMMDKPGLDAEAELAHFFALYYGDAAPMLMAYRALVERRNDEIAAPLNLATLNRRVDLDDAFFAEAGRLLDEAEAAAAEDAPRLARVRIERALVDRVRLDRRAELAPFAPGEREALEARLARGHREAALLYFGENGVADRMRELALYLEGARIDLPPLPEFADRDVAADLAWPQLPPTNGATREPDPDAAGGYAMKLAGGGTLQYGFYDVIEKTMIVKSLGRNAVPRDGKYHLYSVGRIRLNERCYLWANSDWRIQRPLDEYYENTGVSNDYYAYLSLKATGPGYVAGGAGDDALWLDRVVLVRAGPGGPPPVAPLPEALAGRDIVCDLTWPELNEAPAYDATFAADPGAAGGIALRLGSGKTGHDKPLRFGVYDVAGKRMLANVAAGDGARAEGYRLYSLGVVELSPQCYVWVHESCFLQRALGAWHDPAGDNRCEVFVSVRAEGPAYRPGDTGENAVWLDRVVLARPRP